jgi:acyl-CoA thioester hydrolase
VNVHRLTVRVYYEDTDLAGIVYHANYLKFMERGRTEALRDAGVDQTRLKAEGLVFVVTRMAIDFRRPARFDDVLAVETETTRLGAATVEMRQRVLRGTETMAEAEVRVACMAETGRAVRLPASVRAALG